MYYIYIYKGKFYPRTGHKSPEGEWRYSPTLSLTSAVGGGGWSTPRPSRSTPGKTQYPLYRRLGGPQGRSGWVWKISPSTGFDPRPIQLVTSLYTFIYIHTHTHVIIPTFQQRMSDLCPDLFSAPLKYCETVPGTGISQLPLLIGFMYTVCSSKCHFIPCIMDSTELFLNVCVQMACCLFIYQMVLQLISV